MADSELLDAREAMNVLGINEGDLQTLVARGDLRAFRAGGTMKFRRDDVSALKTEKGTEPTIIIPAASARAGQASGILPTVGARPATRTGSAVRTAVPPPSESATGEILLDEIELMPTDDAANTQHVTIASSALGELGGATVVDHAAQTGELTVLDDAPTSTTARGSGVRTAVGSGIRGAVPGMAKPAMSRVQAAVSASSPGGVSMATSRRTQAAYQAKSANPIWTAIAILNTIIFMFAATIVGVMMSRGTFDRASGQRIIPPFLNHESPTPVYKWYYDSTPGTPKDDKPQNEWPSAKP